MNYYWLLTILTVLLLFISHRIYFSFIKSSIKYKHLEFFIFACINFQLAFLLPIYLYHVNLNNFYLENNGSQLLSVQILVWFFLGNLVSSFYIFYVKREHKLIEDMYVLDSLFYIIMKEMVFILFWPIFFIISIFLLKKH